MEKALKALLVQHQIEFPYTHAIGPLLNLCQAAGYEGTESLGDATILTATPSLHVTQANKIR